MIVNASSNRSIRWSNGRPKAWNSVSFQPAPSPNTNRPSARRVQPTTNRRMIPAMDDRPSLATVANEHPYRAEVELEHARWTETVALVRSIGPEARLRPGYYRDPDWTVKDLVAHLGTWMAEAEVQLLRIE